MGKRVRVHSSEIIFQFTISHTTREELLQRLIAVAMALGENRQTLKEIPGVGELRTLINESGDHALMSVSEDETEA